MMKTSIPKMHLPEKQRICPGSDFPSLLAVAAGCFCLPVALATGAPMLEGVVWEEDFESGSVAGWESYPSFQDTAYDFTLYPGRYIGPGELRGNIFSGGITIPPWVSRPLRELVKTAITLCGATNPRECRANGLACG